MTITRRPSNLTRSDSSSSSSSSTESSSTSTSTSTSTSISTFTSSSSIAEEAAKHSDPMMHHQPRAKRVRISETVVMIEIEPNQAPIRTRSTTTGSGSTQEEARTPAPRCNLPQPWSLRSNISAPFSISRWDNGHTESRDVAPTAAIRKRRSTTDIIDLALAIVNEDDFLQ